MLKINRATYLLGLLLVNICIAALVIYIGLKFQETKINDINSNESNYSFSLIPQSVLNQINLGSRAFIIYDTNSREIVAGKNERLRFAPASSAKIMAATIVLQNYDLDRVLTSKNLDSLGSDNSKMKLIEDEQMTVRNLLYGMMLPSGNDAAYVLAQNFPGGVGAFVAKMNEKAKTLKLTNTHFVDPDGYDDANYTTAYDLARLGSYSMKNSAFAKIVGTRYKLVYDISGQIPHHLENLNVLLGKDGVNGIKTGFTDEAKGVLVTSINNKNKNYIVVVLGSQDRFSDTKNVIDNALSKISTFLY